MSADARPHPSVTWPRRLGFGMGGAGSGIAFVPIATMLLFYLTDTLHLRPALAGLVVGLPKVWDVIVDPWFGGVVDRAGRRAGRRAPVALIAGAGYVAAVWLLFSLPDLPRQWMVALICGALLVALSMMQTGFEVTRLAVADDLSPDAAERTSLLAIGVVMAGVLGLAATAAVPSLVAAGGGGHQGYRLMANAIGAGSTIAFACYLLSIWRSPVSVDAAAAHDLPLAAALRAVACNRAFLGVISALVCSGITGSVLGAFLPFANQYVLRGSAASLSTLFLASGIASLLSLPLTVLLTRRYGVRWTLLRCSVLVALSFLALFAASFGPLWLSWMAAFFIGLGLGGQGVLLQTAVIDISKINLPGAGVVPLGLYLGVLVAAQKLAQSGGALVGGILLDGAGFEAGAAQQSATTLLALRAGYTLIPFALMLVSSAFLRLVVERASSHTPPPAPPAAVEKAA